MCHMHACHPHACLQGFVAQTADVISGRMEGVKLDARQQVLLPDVITCASLLHACQLAPYPGGLLMHVQVACCMRAVHTYGVFTSMGKGS